MMHFALVGNPNCGKTTLFNTLTGSTAHVGNWPGVTVDRKEGVYKKLHEDIGIVDLPGIYSLSPYTPEEIVARNYIIDEHPDLVINIIDATNLERNLYLTTQLMETDCPVVVALNMMDEVKKRGGSIDIQKLQTSLGMPVIEISAIYTNGVKQLMETAYKQACQKRAARTVLSGTPLGCAVTKLMAELTTDSVTHPLFHAVKILEGDKVEEVHVDKRIIDLAAAERRHIRLDPVLDNDFEAAIADLRYKYITANCSPAYKRNNWKKGPTATEKIDKWLTHKYLGIPIFFLFMLAIFHCTFSTSFLFIKGLPSPGVFLQDKLGSLLDFIVNACSIGLEKIGVTNWVHGLVIDGLLTGISSVLSFLPQIVLLFLFLSILEDSGYMARAAFLMDKPLRRFGISGRAFMPLLMGFGCSVPAMMGTKTLETERDRRFTVMLIPFFSCGAKLPVWLMFASIFFKEHTDLAVFGIYAIGIVTAIIAGIFLKKFVFKGEAATFIMELPAYHMPRAKNIVLLLWEKVKDFITRASTIIAGASVVIWFLANFGLDFKPVAVPNSAESLLGQLGSALTFFFKPLGFASGAEGWKPVVAILTGLIAREVVVSSLGVLYPTADALAVAFGGIPAALSFMTFILLSIPCMASIATMHGEMNSKKWTAGTLVFWTATAWVMSFAVYWIATGISALL